MTNEEEPHKYFNILISMFSFTVGLIYCVRSWSNIGLLTFAKFTNNNLYKKD